MSENSNKKMVKNNVCSEVVHGNIIQESKQMTPHNNLGVLLPIWAKDSWKLVGKEDFEIAKLKVCIFDQDNNHTIFVNINQTPHYKFIRAYMQYGEKLKWRDSDYFRYEKKYWQGEDSVKNFISLYHSITSYGYTGGQHSQNACLVYKRLPFESYKVLDGLHRIAILSAVGHSKLQAGIVAHKVHFSFRVFKKLIGLIKF